VNIDQATLCLIPDENSSHCFIKTYCRVYDDNLLDKNLSLKKQALCISLWYGGWSSSKYGKILRLPLCLLSVTQDTITA